jgi:hypothetical protein
MSAIVNRSRDSLTRVTTAGRIVAHGTPLHRLQAVHESPDEPVLVGDLLDSLAAICADDGVVARLKTSVTGKGKNERILVAPEDVAHITDLHLSAA